MDLQRASLYPPSEGAAAQLFSSRRQPTAADRRTNVWHEEHRCIAFIKRDMDTHKLSCLSSQLIHGYYADQGRASCTSPTSGSGQCIRSWMQVFRPMAAFSGERLGTLWEGRRGVQCPHHSVGDSGPGPKWGAQEFFNVVRAAFLWGKLLPPPR